MYHRCCRIMTMMAVNAAPAAAVLLTDSTNSTAVSHFLITPSTSSAGMSTDRHDAGKTTININNGLLLYHHQCSFYSQKVGHCFCFNVFAKMALRFFNCISMLTRTYIYFLTSYDQIIIICFYVTQKINKKLNLTFPFLFMVVFFSDKLVKMKLACLFRTCYII